MPKKKRGPYQLTQPTATAWQTCLSKDDAEELIAQAHKDAAYFRRHKRFPKEERNK